MKTRIRRLLVIVPLAVLAGLALQPLVRRIVFRPSAPGDTPLGSSAASVGDALATVVTGLDVPWAMAFLPSGRLLATERPGRLVLLEPATEPGGGGAGPTGPWRVAARWTLDGIRTGGEAGLMGLAVDPGFEENRRVWVCHTAEGPSGAENRIVRFRLEEAGPVEPVTILGGIPGASFHDGCALAFGPEGFLYASTGDAGSAERAQVRASLAGKVLRLALDGSPAPGNPFGTPVWSWGHRNPQGLAFDEQGNLWATEHGRSGAGSGMDEINRIRPGANYGWPRVEGDETAPGMEPPIAHSGSETTWAPAGAAYLDGSVWFGALRGEAVYEARIVTADSVELTAHFFGDFGRIRAVAAGPDGRLWFATSNRDGRGRPADEDDRIFAVAPEALRTGALLPSGRSRKLADVTTRGGPGI